MKSHGPAAECRVDRLLNDVLSSHTSELEALVRDAPLGFGYLALPEFKFRYVNDALASISGVSPEEMLDKTPKEILGSVISERHYSIVRRSLIEGSTVREMEAEVEMPGYPGQTGLYLINYYPVRNAAGEVTGIWVTVQDVTERRRMEEEIPAHRARLQTLMDTVPAGILLSDAEGNLVYANSEAERIWGHPLRRTGIEGYREYGLFHPDGQRAAPEESILARILDGRHDRLTSERIVKRPDGTMAHVFSAASPIRDAEGKVTGGLLVFSDITPLKELEKRQLRITSIAQAVNAGRGLSEILRMVRDAVVETAGFDRAGIWLYDPIAGGMRGAWGTGRDGSPVDESREFFALSPTGETPLQCILRGELSYYLTPRYEFADFPSHGINMSGVRSHATLALRAQDRVIGMLFVDTLLTGREIAESDLEALVPFCEQAALAIDSAQLREAEREKAERLEHAMRETNHRVKNNLQVVAALMDMQLMESGETVGRAELQRLVGQIRAIASVHDFLTHGSLDLDVDVQQVLGKLLPMVGASTSARCVLECDPGTITVKQGTALALVINELVSNAAKHGATDVGVRFRIQDGSKCTLEVYDNGPGFPPGFDIASDGHLGLDLVRTLARWDLQGTISAGNVDSGGANVTIEFGTYESGIDPPMVA